MKLLITGSKGQLGTELAAQLAAGRGPLGPVDPRYAGAQVVGVDLDTVDITDSGALQGLVDGGGFDIVFNCASFTDVNACETAPELARAVNARAVGDMARLCAQTGAKLVHISTDYVFSGDDRREYVETDEPNPATVYGKTKLEGERLAQRMCPGCLVVRTAWLYGRCGKNFVKTMLALAERRGELTVVNDQFGNPTNAADLSQHLLALAVSGQSGIFHCTNNGITNWCDFAAEIMRLFSKGVKVIPCTTGEYAKANPGLAPRPNYSPLDNRRLRGMGADRMRDWRQALAAFAREHARDFAGESEGAV
uniref:dTDP-4-dehydrorhamnose reductase n=1 Tax=uncultured bacterium contig00006 TaxID=1181498 RepID=A0A806KK98_9BACT|nr:dTDP-4-dehydrorhamnose reductase [uncultured bacterium contig00006]